MILTGDAIERLKEIGDGTVDAVVTDPPYGLSFMGKSWDRAVPPVEVWRECLRVLKPGAFAFVMSIPRQDCQARMITSLEEAAFVTGFTPIYWTYASGFPKAQNIGKAVDKKLGAEREVVSVKERKGNPVMTFGGNTENLRPYQKKQIEEHGHYVDIETAPATPEARALDGAYAGYQPKPAVEIILVVMKPLSEKTYVEQALANRKGVTWLGDCKVPINPVVDNSQVRQMNRSKKTEHNGWGMNQNTGDNPEVISIDGRFPANLLVSDNVLDRGEIRKSKRTNMKPDKGGTGNSLTFAHNEDETRGHNDTGDYSRFFSLDAWDEKMRSIFAFIEVPKPSKAEKNAGLGGAGEYPKRYGEMKGTPEHAPIAEARIAYWGSQRQLFTGRDGD